MKKQLSLLWLILLSTVVFAGGSKGYAGYYIIKIAGFIIMSFVFSYIFWWTKIKMEETKKRKKR